MQQYMIKIKNPAAIEHFLTKSFVGFIGEVIVAINLLINLVQLGAGNFNSVTSLVAGCFFKKEITFFIFKGFKNFKTLQNHGVDLAIIPSPIDLF